MHYQEKVKEFMVAFEQECPSRPTVTDEKTRKLRVKLLLEEVLELAEASAVSIKDSLGHEILLKDLKNGKINLEINSNTPDIVGVADALADISYVNYGAANAYGIDLQPIEEEVHNSNMTKLFTKEETLTLVATNYILKIINDKKKCVLVKNLDGKIQKSPSYAPANISTIINSQIDK